jgi:hypothetical protein
MGKHMKSLALSDVKEILNGIKLKNKSCTTKTFGNKNVTKNQLKGLDYVPNHFRNLADHCDKPWYECY